MADPPDERELRELLDVLSRPWTLELIRRLEEGPAQYAELADATDRRISPATLTARLKALVAIGLAERVERKGPPRRIRYRATDKLRVVMSSAEGIRRAL